MDNDLPTDTHDRIELRSRKVCNIIGSRPPLIVRYGTIIVVAVMTLIIIAAALIPYTPDGTSLLRHLLPDG